MIVWVNGAFGAGKTQAAFELARRLGRAVVCDPEVVGYGLQKLVPRELRRDFQLEPAWSAGVVDGVSRVDTWPGCEVVVVPMTVVDADRVDDLLGALRRGGHDVRHVVLDCSEQTLRRRLRWRLDALRDRETWAVRQIGRCRSALAGIDADADPLHVDTDPLTHDEVVEAIAEGLGLRLVRPRHGPLMRVAQTLGTSARVIRF